MKFYLDDEFIFELNEIQQKVLKHQWFSETFKQELKRRVEWVIMHNYTECLKELVKDWQPKIKDSMIPTNTDKLCELIFKQEGYASRSERDQMITDNVMDRKDLKGM